MKLLTIRNDFTNLEIRVDPSKTLTVRKIKFWRSKLCASDCESGDVLGGRGKQEDDDAYRNLVQKAERVMAMHVKRKWNQ